MIGDIRDERAAETAGLVRAAGGTAIAVHVGDPHVLDH